MGELNTVYLLLGSNMGDRLNYLSQARDVIKSSLGNIVSESSIYETEPWHTKDQDTYLNQAIEVLSELTATKFHELCLSIEKQLGRTDRTQWEEREIDIDIIFFGEEVIQSASLTVPHPRMQERNFVILPLMEIAPEFMHPILKKTIEELYEESNDEAEVYLFEAE